MDDWQGYIPDEFDKTREMVVLDNIIFRSDIPKYFDESFYSFYNCWLKYKKWGMPYSGGWAEQPSYLINILESFDRLIEKKKGKNGV